MPTLFKVLPEARAVRQTLCWAKAVLLHLCAAWLVWPGLLLAGTANPQSQDFVGERWTARDGLPDSTILALAQTQDGALWVGTAFGLARFDGAQFTVFNRENLPDLRSNNINFLATGPDSQLYMGTDNGFVILSHGRSRTFGKREGLDGTRVLVVFPAGVDDAWFGTISGSLYHYAHGTIEKTNSDILSHEPIYGLARAQNGGLWIGAGSGLFSWQQGVLTRYKPKIPLPVVGIYDLAVSQDGSLFAASDGGLFEIQGDHWISWTTQSGLPSNSLNVLHLDSQGVLWIGSNKGLARLVNGALQAISSVNCPTHFLFMDKEKSLWVGCDEAKGLMRVTTPQVSFLSVPRASDPAAISSLVEDHSGAVWMASNRGLFRYQNHRFQRYTRREGLPSNAINGVTFSSSGALWIATADGFASLRKGHFQSFRIKSSAFVDPFFSVLEDRDRTVWVTSGQGLLRRRAGETTFENLPEATDSIWSVREDREGALWVGTTSHGLFRFRGNTRTDFTTTSGLASNTVYDTAQDDSGWIWASTSRGLSRIQGDKCASIGVNNGLPPGRPNSIVIDHHGHLWLRTQDGISAIDLAEANHAMDHGGSLMGTRYFGPDNGFGNALSDSSVQNPLQLHSSGDIWIPTFVGIAIMHTAVLETPVPQLSPLVTAVVSDFGEHDLTAPVKLRPGDLHLEFSYRVPYLLGARNREYRYRLDGFDKDWREGGKRREAMYTSLPPGRYHFQVSARLPFESWSEASAPIALIVLPHLYQTWWWYALLTLVLATSIVLVYRVRFMAVRNQYALIMTERTRERSRLARELHDTLSQGMMAIHLQIQLARALLRSEPDSASSHLDNAISIVRDSASETRKCIAALRSDAEDNLPLRDMLGKAVSRFTESSEIPLAVTIDDRLPLVSQEVAHEIMRVTEEALANVRMHSGARQASLFVRTSGNWLRIEVLDNGRGFEMSDHEPALAGHFGLTGMKERAQRIHANLETRSNPGKGTSIVLEVPVEIRGRGGRGA